jgi:4-oxalocrotonate tautomerase
LQGEQRSKVAFGDGNKEKNMPIVQIHMMEGRSDAQKEAVIREVTEALVRALDAPKESVRVLINEMPKQHFGIAGESAKARGR